MGRFWIGVGVLLGLLALSFGATAALEAIHGEIFEALDQAGQAALSGDWAKADALAEKARDRWQKYWRFTAALHDHEKLDEADGYFAELEVFRREKEALHYAAACSQLSQLVVALSEGVRFNWWNLLTGKLLPQRWESVQCSS